MLHSRLVPAGLTSLQLDVVQAPVDSRQLVLGGAGTGKTHVLVERIRHLIESDDVAPGSDLLVLSFTRAVVRDLRARLRLGEGLVRLVRPLTFDSFATKLLGEMPPGEAAPGWRDAGYDGRIAAATAAIRGSRHVPEALASCRHVFVDEIQDLVGVRADMVLEILPRVEGFTVLGDPAQAIYDYQLQGDPGATTSAEFLEGIVAAYKGLRTVVFDDDFRAAHPLGAAIAEIGATLRDPRRDTAGVHDALVDVLGALDHVGSFEDLPVALRGTHEPTAVLCRTNAESLRISQLLFEAGIDHRLQHEATERVLPAWLAGLFRGVDRKRWSERGLESLIAQRREENVRLPETTVVVRLLTDAVGDDTVDLDVLRERLRRGAVPDHIHEVDDVPIVISTIHRAKGLEFDRVFFGAPWNGIPEDDLEELRVLYVALSRSREDLWSFKAPKVANWHMYSRGGDERWVKAPWNERWKTLGWEIKPVDVDAMRPAGCGFAGADVAELQTKLTEQFRRGAEVELHLVHVRESEEPIPFYTVTVDGEIAGQTNEAFAEALRRRLGRARPSFPPAMSTIFLTGVETVVGSATEGEAGGLGLSGLWLRPRIAGLATVDWHA
jgi:AAA domain/UvrD-like helicase C-terminal domain